MKPTVWHVMIAVLLIGYVLGATALIAYVLYGPGFEVKVPDVFGLNPGTTTAGSSGDDTSIPVPDPLAKYPGVLFECEGDKVLKAEFLEEKVNLVLSDGRQLSLPQTASSTEGGARYANTNESFVFWNKGDTAFIEENGARTYTDCATKSQN